MKEFYVGSYQKAEQAGIARMAVDEGSGEITCLGAFAGADNPSFVLPHPDGKLLYAVEELVPEGRVSVFSVKDGALEKVQTYSTLGADPCHLSLDETGRFLFAANYTSGSLMAYRLGADGLIEDPAFLRTDTGSSVYAGRQDSAHVHFSRMIDGVLYVCDLGEDKIHRFTASADGELQENLAPLAVPAGYGPRHLTECMAHPGFLYVITEMGGKVLVFRKTEEPEGYQMVQEVTALPDDTEVFSLPVGSPGAMGAAIRCSAEDGFLYASVRGTDTIAAYRIGEDGLLSAPCISPAGTRMPRDFQVFGSFIVCAGQEGNTVVSLKREQDGRLTETGHAVSFEKPVCIAQVP